MRKLIGTLLLGSALSVPAFAQDTPVSAHKPLEARAEVNVRGGSERSILMNEFWVPLTQTDNSVLYGDIRLMGDDQDNREFNAGVGYRHIVRDVPLLGDGVAGIHGWVDRRITERGSRFNQITAGAEWSGDVIDLKLNGYMPVSDEKNYAAGTAATSAPYLAGSGIFYNATAMTVTEEPQPGLDLELGFSVNGIIGDFADSTRVYAGAYHFAGDKTDDVTGWRARVASDITEDFQLGARFQRDDERGSQGFLEATIRFPFGNKKSYREHGLYARLDESPERDIDIVTAAAAPQPTGPEQVLPVINTASGSAQRVLYVDNTAAPGGTGTLDNPFNSLAAAQAALADNDVVYVASGDGTTANMNNGFTIDKSGVQMIGSGSTFVYDGGRFTTGLGNNFTGTVLRSAGAAPSITNAAGDGIYVTGANALVSGFTLNNTNRYGLYAYADGANLGSVTVSNVTANNNGTTGVMIYANNSGAFDTVSLSGLHTDDNAASSGISVTVDGNARIGTAIATDIVSNGNAHYGLNFFSGTAGNGVGDIDNIYVDGLSASGNDYAGLFFRSRALGSLMGNVVATNITSNNNVTTNGRGVYVQAFGSGSIGTLWLDNVTASGNVSEGIRIEADSAASRIESVTVTNATLTGSTGASGYGVLVRANNAATIANADLLDVTASGNSKHGLYFLASGTASITASVQDSIATGNVQHGIAVYDDTSGTFDIDLGGGGRSAGRNVLAGNTLEDLALDYDGRMLAAMNNWWGQATGPDQDAPNIGIRPQIYYGAPINDGLVTHLTFDSEWMNGTTVYDRSGNNNNGTLFGGISAGDAVVGRHGEALSFDGINDYLVVSNLDLSSTAAATAIMQRYKSDFVPLSMDLEFSPNFNSSSTGFGIFPNDSTGCAGKIAASIRGNAGYNIECYQRPSANAWHEYAGVFNKAQAATNEASLYIDGAAATFINQTHALDNTNNFGVNNLYLMARGGTSLFESELIDDVRIYNRALSAAEISEIYRMDTTSSVDFSGFMTSAP